MIVLILKLALYCILLFFSCSAVGGILDNLHGIATDMGDELDRQNDQLIRVNRKAHVNVGHLGSANDRMRRQL